jgi:hypothetical protein
MLALVPPLLTSPHDTSKIQREERAMRLVVRKLEVPDLGQLQSLVIEHLDGIEAGLTVVDSRLLLGHATVDIVALDAEGALVLVTAGFTADEEMLMKAVEAYSWCLEYPEAIRRLYPSVEISAARPPRLMFVVERLPDAFHRKIKQLGFSEVDCVEFRHLDVSGTPAAYFDTIARLRRGPGLAEFQPAPIARRVSEPQMRRAPEPVDKVVDHGDKVVPLVSSPNSARATSVRLQKMLNTTGPSHGNGGSPVIDFAARTAAPRVETPRPELTVPHAQIAPPRVEAARIETPALRIETPSPRIETPAPEIELPRVEIAAPTVETIIEIATPAIETPVESVTPAVEVATAIVEPVISHVESSAPRIETPVAVIEPVARVAVREAPAARAAVAVAARAPQSVEPRVSFAEIAKELLGSAAPAPRAEATTAREPVLEITRATLEDIAAAAAASVDETESAVVIEATPADAELQTAVATLVEEASAEPIVAAPVVAEKPAPVAPVAPKPVFTAPRPVPAAPKPIAPAPTPVAPAPKPIAPASKPVVAAPKPAVAAPKPVAPAPKPAIVAQKPAAAAPPAAPKPAAVAAPVAQPTEPETPAQNLPQEFEGLKFPHDGVLTRQWMEFLNQMASSK